jgi:phospholipase/carboxylesterase
MPDAQRPRLSLVHRVRRPTRSAGSDGARPPLLVLLHGIASNELAMAALSDAFDPRFVVVSPRAPIELEPFAFAWFPMAFTPEGPRIDGGDLERAWTMLPGFLDEAVAAYDIDPDQVYVAGFSQGGMLALSTMLTSPERLAGVVCMSGHLPGEVLPHVVDAERRSGKPVLIVHGTRDETLPVTLGRSARDVATGLGLSVDYVELDLPHTTTDESLAIVSAWLRARLDR